MPASLLEVAHLIPPQATLFGGSLVSIAYM